MKSDKQEPVQVSKRNIERLFKELSPRWYGISHRHDERIKELEKDIDHLEEGFNSSPPVVKLVKEKKQLFYAHGPTPAVLKQVQKLVEDANRDA